MKWVAPRGGFDEVFDPRGEARPHYAPLIAILESFTTEDVERRERLQQMALRTQGVTFTVYGEKEGLERIFPFDFVPRIIPAAEWKRLQDGLVQRITTLNLFLADVYHEQKCLKDRVVPPELVLSRKEYKRPLLGLMPARKIFTHVVGTDIIRNDRGEYLVLEDNCRVPSGVSYVLENRNLLSRVFPEFLGAYPVRPIKDYPTLLLETLRFVAPRRGDDPVVVILSPGIHNSAYFEHSFLAREMGVPLGVARPAAQALADRLGMAAGNQAVLVEPQARPDRLERNARGQDRRAEAPALRERGRRHHAAPDRRVRPLVDPRPQRGQAHLEELALVRERRLGPRARQDLERLGAALAAVVAAEAVAHELVLVVQAAAAHADVEPAVAQVVEQRQLHREPDRMAERQLDDGKADAHPARARGERARERDRVAVDRLAGEVVLGEPDRVEADRLGQPGLLELLADGRVVLLG